MISTHIRVGISSCLLGQAVRYDGGHKHNEYVTRFLGRFFEFVPFCPEVAIGLGIPRPPIRLVGHVQDVRAQGVEDTGIDVTEKLVAYADRVVPTLQDVSGYILKQNSPSCGMEGVKVHRPQEAPAADGVGVYARALRERLPELPFEEEGRLMDPVSRESFIERVFIYHRWQQLVPQLTLQSLVEFHARHDLILLAHDEQAYGRLGRSIGDAASGKIADYGARYVRQLMQSLKKPATRSRHAKVLQHALGLLKRSLEAADKGKMLTLIERYQLGQVSLNVPMAMMRQYLRRFPQPYLEQQHYFAPYPDELLMYN